MKKVLAASIAALLSTGSFATVLTFDDVTSDISGELGNYGGLDWSNMGVLNANERHQDSGYNNGLVSGDYVAYNQYANVASVADDPFTFNGAYLTGAWNDGLNITVKGYQGNDLAYEKTVVVDSDAPTYFDFNFKDITNLVFESFGGIDNPDFPGGAGEHFAMDNFTFNVPEPGTFLLMGLGLLGLYTSKRRYA